MARAGDSSVIGPSSVVRGNVHGDGDLDIQGRVEGSVEVAGDLLIGEGALVKSDVLGRRVVVRGAIAGNVSGTESVVLEAGARVVGDLAAPSIGIRPGALVRGNVSTSESKARDAGASKRAAPARAPVVAATRTPLRAPVPRPAPPPVRTNAAPARPQPPPPPREEVILAPPPAAPSPVQQDDAQSGPPLPIVPSLRKGAKAQLRKKGAR